MKDIKEKNRIQHTIKSIDRASIAQHHMKNAYMKIKEMGQENDSSPSSFAEEKASASSRRVASYAVNRAEVASGEVSKKVISTIKGKQVSRSAVKHRNIIKGIGVKSEGSVARTYTQTHDRKQLAKRQKIFARKRTTEKLINHNIKSTAKNAVDLSKRVVTGATKSVKAIVESTKALVTAIAAGGWVAILAVVICVMFGAALYFFGDESSNTYTPVSPEVEAYTPVISKYATQYEIGEYVELIKAIMMQESGGKGNDPMQASESGYNTKYPRKPNSIKDPNYSIECGVRAIASCLKESKCKTPLDMDNISLALQGYNFGNVYISWAVSKYGGYSLANAEEFSKEQAKKNGWASYGDINYVDHVLRYYPYGNFSYDIEYNGSGRLGLPISGMSKSHITSYFGPRTSPGGFGSTDHKGLDIGYPTGTHVLACEKGTATVAGWYGGYGKCIILDHGNGLQTIYGHLSSVNIKKGQKVLRGQYIGNVGSTGNSTGPHLHLGVTVNGKFVNPLSGWISLAK